MQRPRLGLGAASTRSWRRRISFSACARVRPSRVPGGRTGPSLRLMRLPSHRHWPYSMPRWTKRPVPVLDQKLRTPEPLDTPSVPSLGNPPMSHGRLPSWGLLWFSAQGGASRAGPAGVPPSGRLPTASRESAAGAHRLRAPTVLSHSLSATGTRACRPSGRADGTERPRPAGPCCCSPVRSPGPRRLAPPRSTATPLRGRMRAPSYLAYEAPPFWNRSHSPRALRLCMSALFKTSDARICKIDRAKLAQASFYT
jgi:hypothetical protein